MSAAEQHKSAGLAAVTGTHYEGGLWLGSFAVYLVTRRGMAQSEFFPTKRRIRGWPIKPAFGLSEAVRRQLHIRSHTPELQIPDKCNPEC
jgi:hypothetical protein